MITCHDEDYKATKLIKQGKESLREEFQPFAEWIDQTFGVKPLNITYYTLKNGHQGLQLIFEFKADAVLFENSPWMPNPEKHKLVTDRFQSLYSDRYDTKNLFMITSAFAQLAIEQANLTIPEEKNLQFKSQLACEEFWDMWKCFNRVALFLYTEEQVKKLDPARVEQWKKMYYRMLKENDEFGYINEESFYFAVDSKENLDKKYDANFRFYFG